MEEYLDTPKPDPASESDARNQLTHSNKLSLAPNLSLGNYSHLLAKVETIYLPR